MNVIIVSLPLVFHIIKLPECSCISVWALTKSIQTLCCAIIQITHAHRHTYTHTHTCPAPHLSYQSSTMALITMINTQHTAMQGTFLFTVGVCGEFFLHFFFCCSLLSLLCRTMHREDYQLLSDALTVELLTLAARYCSDTQKHRATLFCISHCRGCWLSFVCWKENGGKNIKQRNNSAVFMERAWSTLKTWQLLWICWGVQIRPAAMVQLKSVVSLIKQLPIWKGLPYPLSTPGLCEMNKASLASLTQAPLGLETFFHNCV